MVLDNGYGIGVYVGYDDNQPMRRGSTRITGSAGALPAWTEIAKALIRGREYVQALDPVDLSFSGLAIERTDLGQKNFSVLKDYGGRLAAPLKEVDSIDRYQPSIITFGSADAERRFSPARSYAPFWLNQMPSGRGAIQPRSTAAENDEASLD